MKQKRTVLLLILVLVLLLAGASFLYAKLSKDTAPEQMAVTEQPEETTQPDIPPAPDFTVYDMDGNEVHLYDFVGTPLVVNFWASWCGPCQMEMPDFQEKFLELDGQVQFLMINMTDGSRETVETASAFIAEKGYTFPVFYDIDSDAAMTYGAYSLPMTFFIDAQGYAVTYATGAISGDTLQTGIDMIVP